MNENIFTAEFYKKVAEAIHEEKKNVDGFGQDGRCSMSITVDGYEICLGVRFHTSLHDESFSHAFGIWHDPCPYWEAENIEDISDVEVFDDDGALVDGFDTDTFWAQFERDYYGNKKKGDKVMCWGTECTFISYNDEMCMAKVLMGEKVHFCYPDRMKKVDNEKAA